MKSTDNFKKTIQTYLDSRAINDTLFAAAYAKSGKNIEDCCTYILNVVKESGCNGFHDSEIFSIATDYYYEDNIQSGNSIDCKAVVNHTVELTAEEKEQARIDAIKRIENEAYAKMKQQNQRTTPKKTEVKPQPSLFDF